MAHQVEPMAHEFAAQPEGRIDDDGADAFGRLPLPQEVDPGAGILTVIIAEIGGLDRVPMLAQNARDVARAAAAIPNDRRQGLDPQQGLDRDRRRLVKIVAPVLRGAAMVPHTCGASARARGLGKELQLRGDGDAKQHGLLSPSYSSSLISRMLMQRIPNWRSAIFRIRRRLKIASTLGSGRNVNSKALPPARKGCRPKVRRCAARTSRRASPVARSSPARDPARPWRPRAGARRAARN